MACAESGHPDACHISTVAESSLVLVLTEQGPLVLVRTQQGPLVLVCTKQGPLAAAEDVQ